MDRSAVILADGISSVIIEEDWLLSELHGKPLILRAVDAIKEAVAD
jgi:molybdopterin-guanine dinucleotide biosynthesis protein A